MQPATQKIVAPVRIPTTSGGGATVADLHHPKSIVTGVVTTAPGLAHIKTTLHGLQATTGGVQLPQGVLATMPFVKGVHQQPMQSQQHVTVGSAFASHLPKGRFYMKISVLRASDLRLDSYLNL